METKWVVFGIMVFLFSTILFYVIKGEYELEIARRKEKEKILKGMKTNTALGTYTDILQKSYYKEDGMKQKIRNCNNLVQNLNQLFFEEENKTNKEWIKRMNLKREKVIAVLEKYKEYDKERRDILAQETFEIIGHVQKELDEELTKIKATIYKEDVEKIKEKRKEIENI